MSLRRFVGISQYATGTGKGCKQFTASLAGCSRLATGDTGGTFDAWGSAEAMTGYSATDFSSYRIVSWGVKFWTISSPTTTEGVIGVITTNGTTFADLDSESTLYPSHERMSAYDCIGEWHSKPEGVVSQSFVDITAAAEGWSGMSCYFTSAAVVNGGTPIVGEIIYNVEFHAASDNLFAQAMSSPSPDLPEVRRIAANVLPNIPDVAYKKDSGRSIWSYVSEAVTNFAIAAGPTALEVLVAML